jgi:hypothetical protein
MASLHSNPVDDGVPIIEAIKLALDWHGYATVPDGDHGLTLSLAGTADPVHVVISACGRGTIVALSCALGSVCDPDHPGHAAAIDAMHQAAQGIAELKTVLLDDSQVVASAFMYIEGRFAPAAFLNTFHRFVTHVGRLYVAARSGFGGDQFGIDAAA